MTLEHIRGLVARGRYTTALRLAVQVEGPDRCGALIAGAHCAYQLRMYGEAARLAREGQDLAKTPELAAKASINAGTALVALGEYTEAERFLLQAAEQSTDEPFLTATVRYGLGRVYERQKRYDTAIWAYETAAEMYLRAGSSGDYIDALHNAAWLALSDGRLTQAASLLSAYDLAGQLSDQQRIDRLTLQACHAWREGCPDAAAELCEDVLVPGHPGSTAWSRCCALCLIAQLAADQGELQAARAFLQKAADHVMEAQDVRLCDWISGLRKLLS